MAACGGNPTAEQAAPAPGPAADPVAFGTGLGTSGSAEPLTPAERWRLSRAVDDATVRCMAGKGLRYTPPANDLARHEPWFRSVDALRDGYGLSTAETQPNDADPNAAHLAGRPESEQAAWRSALLGTWSDPVSVSLPDGSDTSTSRDGCVSDARIAVYGNLEGVISADFANQALTDRRLHERAVADDTPYRTALARWRACMATAGHPVPEDAGSGRDEAAEGYRRLNAAAARQAEVAIARADAACQQQ